MKLRNKKTGEIGILDVPFPEEDVADEGLVIDKFGGVIGRFSSLAELDEEWEDYEEPKRHWIIDTMNDRVEDFDVPMTFNESIGNYFKTKEEAEKAVEKLKAWKRLKDKGISFEAKMKDRKWYLEPKAEPQQRTFDEAHDLFEDVMLVFGGEE